MPFLLFPMTKVAYFFFKNSEILIHRLLYHDNDIQLLIFLQVAGTGQGWPVL